MSSPKAYKGMAMEGLIATWYASITRSELRHKQVAVKLVEKIPPGSRVLEIAPGPGYFSIELAKLGDYQVTGVDISKSFVEMARRNAKQAGVKVDFRQGNASAMPFADGSFDFTFCQAAFKNFTEPVKAMAEMDRVLVPGGTAVIVDLRSDASRKEIERHIQSLGLGRINQILTRWTFQQMLLKSAYTISQMEAFVSQTPFRTCRVDADDIGFTAWLGK